jgi:hypothetical protein
MCGSGPHPSSRLQRGSAPARSSISPRSPSFAKPETMQLDVARGNGLPAVTARCPSPPA